MGQKSNKKVRVALLSVGSNIVLVILKVIVGLITGSVSIISEAIHSASDLLASFIALFSVKVSEHPPDENHPYGHGKYENISGVIEALLIFAAAFWIIYESVNKIMHHEAFESVGIGFVVMFVSAIINFFVARRLYKVAKETDSIALEADALHLKTDVYTSLGVGIALGIIWLTGYYIFDPIIAIIVALFILRESFVLLKHAFAPLVDVKLSDGDIEIIKAVISEHLANNYSFHQLRTRKSGFFKYVDLHLELPCEMSVEESHLICDRLEAAIKKQISNIEVFIHVEPAEKPTT